MDAEKNAKQSVRMSTLVLDGEFNSDVSDERSHDTRMWVLMFGLSVLLLLFIEQFTESIPQIRESSWVCHRCEGGCKWHVSTKMHHSVKASITDSRAS